MYISVYTNSGHDLSILGLVILVPLGSYQYSFLTKRSGEQTTNDNNNGSTKFDTIERFKANG